MVEPRQAGRRPRQLEHVARPLHVHARRAARSAPSRGARRRQVPDAVTSRTERLPLGRRRGRGACARRRPRRPRPCPRPRARQLGRGVRGAGRAGRAARGEPCGGAPPRACRWTSRRPMKPGYPVKKVVPDGVRHAIPSIARRGRVGKPAGETRAKGGEQRRRPGRRSDSRSPSFETTTSARRAFSSMGSWAASRASASARACRRGPRAGRAGAPRGAHTTTDAVHLPVEPALVEQGDVVEGQVVPRGGEARASRRHGPARTAGWTMASSRARAAGSAKTSAAMRLAVELAVRTRARPGRRRGRSPERRASPVARPRGRARRRR